MHIYSPYTYHIAWTSIDKHYYGVRYAKGCNPNDLWVSYFTSSKEVKKYRDLYGEPDVIEVRKVFDCPNKARLWEFNVLYRLQAVKSDRWLNLSNAGTEFRFKKHLEENYSPWNKGKTGIYSEATIQKMSNTRKERKIVPWNKGIPHSEQTKRKISSKVSGSNHSNYGKLHSPETKKKMSEKSYSKTIEGRSRISERQKGSNNSFYGKHHSEESRQKKSIANKGQLWWNNGQVRVKSRTCPPGFKRGKALRPHL